MVKASRLQYELKELAEITRDKNMMSIEFLDEDFMHMRGTIEGAAGTPYEGGEFVVDISLPTDYPLKPPKLQFITKVWHPNVNSETGSVCVEFKDWSPALTLRTVLLSLQGLLSTPQPNDPEDAFVARQYIQDYATFEKIATCWTKAFAGKKDSIVNE